MTNKYPSTFVQQYSTKIAFLIDCANGLNSFALYPRFMDNFPSNSDVFLFYSNNEPGMIRRLKRIEASNHGVFFFPTSEFGIDFNISYILGQINKLYTDFILIVEHHPAYEDICQQLINNNDQLRDHIQVRSFERTNEFEQFIKEITRFQNENENKRTNENHKVVINFSKKHLFHPCPFETRLESSVLYRFGEFLHHLDTQHPNVYYEYCTECQHTIENHDVAEQVTFEEHIRDKHWASNGFHLTIRPI
ncbi:unnamed protein product [Rotaria sordida]|uniref:Uncharacterized protein n=1 Tax=Rotaria sordida TaxID=392033 RepID=A0A819JY85_9BILA|nr:unnamed protein product [Rotaria sordida]CAF3936794.1 unnamed protein product [Rotaria sordida]